MKVVRVSITKAVRLEDECGFCGGLPSRLLEIAPTFVRCFHCNVRTPDCANTEDAIMVWNTWFARVPLADTALETLAALKAARKKDDEQAEGHAAMTKALRGLI